MPRLRRFFVHGCALIALLAASAAYATTMMDAEVRCPVCGEHLTTMIPLSTNNFGGQDRDGLQRARGTQLFTVLVTTCGQCGFTGFPDEFEALEEQAEAAPEPTPEAPPEAEPAPDRAARRAARKAARQDRKLAEGAAGEPTALARAILEPGALTLPEGLGPDASFADLPAWARYDLLGQVKDLGGAGPVELGDASLFASWAVRVEDISLPWGFGEDEARRISDERRRALWDEGKALGLFNEPDLMTWVGARVLAELDEQPEAVRCARTVDALWHLAEYGENEPLLQALPLLEGCFEPEAWAEQRQRILDDVALERRYQQRALAHYQAALEAGVVPEEERVWTTYTVAELQRRLGLHEQAVASFDELLEGGGIEGGFAAVARDQRCMAAGGGGAAALLSCRNTFVEELAALQAEDPR